MKFFKELSILVLIFLSVAVNAQDYGPVKVDVDGYINDRAGEVHKSNPVKPKEEEKKPELKPKVAVDPVEARKQRRRIAAPADTSSNKTSSPATNANLTFGKAKSTESNLPLYIGIGVGALVIFIIAFVVLAKAGKKKRLAQQANADVDSSSLADKIEANQQALMAETTMEAEPIQSSTGSVEDSNFVPHNAKEMADKFASETTVDERGRNPSGLIIDEDKYFTSGSSNFVDEDFQG